MRQFLLLLTLTALASAADLRVTKVVLYKHGVGYFERAGDIPSGEQATLQFKAEEMDDVLKSLTVEQTGGQGVVGVRYDSSDPLAKRLQVFPFDIGRGAALYQILDQFKGAEVQLAIGKELLQGTILSARSVRPSENQAEKQRLLLLVSGSMQAVDPESASAIRFTDSKIQQQFADYLAIVARSRNTDKRTVTIESAGDVTRVAAGYVVPTPIWKSSYRLVFDDESKPLLEGWAIVDNTSGEDWENVRLSLVSGLPVSFISRLYEPRYLQRPVVQLAQDRAWRPTVHGGALEEQEKKLSNELDQVGGARGGYAKSAAPAPMMERAFRQDVAANMPMVADRAEFRAQASSTIAATAERAELGNLFEYAIQRPVTIRKSESAMLPFFRERVAARRLYIYDAANGSQHPLNAAEITNSSDATLDGGAITVYDAGAYVGEALVETVKAGDKRLISYAVDLGTRITTAFGSTSKLQSEIHYRRGVLTTKTAVKETKTFTIRNVDSESKTLILEHPVRGGYELVDMEAEEKTAAAYRFEVELDGDSTKKFPIVEERVYAQTHAVANMTPDQLMSWVLNKELDPAGRERLGEIADAKRSLAELERQAERSTQRIRNLSEDQGRLRSNISTLRSVSGQQQKVMEYSEQLGALEGRLVRERDNQTDLARQIDELRTKLNTLIETMEF